MERMNKDEGEATLEIIENLIDEECESVEFSNTNQSLLTGKCMYYLN